MVSVHAAPATDAASGAAAKPPAEEPTKPGVDYHSFANVADFRVRNVDLDLAVDFTARRLKGHADLTVARQNPSAHQLILDTRDLDIHAVALLAKGGTSTKLTFKIGAAREFLGRPLEIEMPAGASDAIVRVEYE